MKNLLSITLIILLFAACEKESTCTVCTATITAVSDNPNAEYTETTTQVFEEINTDASCSTSHSDYEAKINLQVNSELTDLNALNPQIGINTVDWSVYEYNIVTTLNSLVCTQN